ncbi:MAG: lysyl oxidase family protein [Bacteroidota bacterium]|nr:lysyl oxidase family protein [Bacteroidota bacterium]
MRFINFYIILLLSNFVFSQNNSGCMDISALNYSPENDISDPLSCIYPSECSNNQQLIMIDIVTESWSSEITWNITDNENNIVANSPNLNSFYGDYQVYTTYACLDINENYSFNSFDSYGDGWNGGLYNVSTCNGGVDIANNNNEPPSEYGNEETFLISLIDCSLYGCIDISSCNYDSNATYPSNCIFPDPFQDCNGNCINDVNENSICDELDVFGCTDSSVVNYDESATFDDGSCLSDLSCSNDEIQVDIVISTDSYPSETYFTLNDNSGVVWNSGDSDNINSDYTSYPFQYCLPIDGCYIFTIYDSYGDGIFSGGGIEVYYESELVLFNPEFQYSSSVTMNCPPGFDCNTAVEVEPGQHITITNDYWYLFEPENNGQYEINTCQSDCNTIIYVYDYCTGLLANSSEAFIYYNDDQCDTQSQVFPLFTEGQQYFIRIAADCNEIDWELNYVGPISGCTDETACNFNPIAEIDDESCIYPGNVDCINGPDLYVLPFESTMYLESYQNEDGCAIEEGCLTGYGNRSIIRFDTWIKNVGNQDYFIGSVDDNSNTNQFEWDECHNHWHYKGYAEYVLFDLNGQIIPVGFKNGFCVMDLECSGDDDYGVEAGNYTYGCSVMGISAGCGDIYGSGLSCQWIDITDVPDGEYTFVVRTNWDQDPDALGNIELSYENNWSQTCIGVFTNQEGVKDFYIATDIDGDGIENINDPDIDNDGLMNSEDQDIDGDGILNDSDEFPYGLGDCPSYTDCLGIEYGNSQLDCNGVCGGQSVTGDMNFDFNLDILDMQSYSSEIISDDWLATSCNDLDLDNELTVSDISLLVNCVQNYDNLTRDNQSEPCNFGLEVTNPNDTVTLSIGEINLFDQYIDINVLNPDNEILGYQFKLENIEITSVENLVDNYPITPYFSNDGIILGVSFLDSLIQKNYDSVPLCRVYFSSVEENVCIENIIDIVNQDYENVVTISDSQSCSQSFGIYSSENFTFMFYPNPCSDKLELKFKSNNFDKCNLQIRTLLGKSIFNETFTTNQFHKHISVKDFTSGVYLIDLNIDEIKLSNKLVINQKQ